MIFLLQASRDNSDTYYINKFNNYDEALDFIRNNNEYLSFYRFIEGKELTLTLKFEDESED